MNGIICLDQNYSTTRRVIKVSPEDITGILQAHKTPEHKFNTAIFPPKGKSRQGEGGLRTKGYFKLGGILQSNHFQKKLNYQEEDKKPLLTVITVVYNGERFLEETIASVINQNYDNVEYIVIDGGSSDATLDIIKKYENIIDYWVSEKDDGIYNAMNKGIEISSGQFIGFVNADDYLCKNTLEELGLVSAMNDFDYTIGNVNLITIGGEIKERMMYIENFKDNDKYKLDMVTSHQAFFIKTSFLKKIGHFDINYKLRADYDMVIRAINTSDNYYIFKNTVACFREGGASGSYSTYIENFKLLKKHHVGIIVRYKLTIISLIKLFILKNLSRSLVGILRRKYSSGRFKVFKE